MIAQRHEEAYSFLFAPLRIDGRDFDTHSVELNPQGSFRVAEARVRANPQLEGAEALELTGRDGISHQREAQRPAR